MPKIVYLSSGIPVIMQRIGFFHSFVLGIWIKFGSRHEPPQKRGLSHFIEHLLFQGTKNRDAKRISLEIDSLGGDLNAFTAREFTALYVKGLRKNLDKSIELICDIYSNPLFPEDEIEKERAVILDEIRIVHDSPEEFTHDFFTERVFDESLGVSILGRAETVSTISREDILDVFERFYGVNNTFICCAGNFDENLLIEKLEENLSNRLSEESKIHRRAKFKPTISVSQRDFQEVHICVGFETVPFESELRNSLAVLNCIVGGSVSSRLFQEIREKRGLAYNVYSFLSSYADTGLFGIYTACEAKKVNQVLGVIREIISKISETLTEEEVERAKNQILSQILYSSESASSVMQSLAFQFLYLNRTYSLRQQQRQIQKITLKEVKAVSEFLKPDKMGIALVGPVKEERLNL